MMALATFVDGLPGEPCSRLIEERVLEMMDGSLSDEA